MSNSLKARVGKLEKHRAVTLPIPPAQVVIYKHQDDGSVLVEIDGRTITQAEYESQYPQQETRVYLPDNGRNGSES